MSTTAITLPEHFGRYRIVKKIGQGGMGSVYLAEDKQLGRQVALKVPHFADKDDILYQRFQREAKLAASITHTYLCPVFDVGQIDGTHYFTMPYISGTQLSRRIATQWELLDAVELVRKLALAVDVMHKKGIIHRDLKPSNILIQENGEPILMDFGLAKCLEAAGERLTVAGAALGTPAYMSPEQALGDIANLGRATDIYSLGVILYRLVTGQAPYEGPPMVIYAQLIQGNPMPPMIVNGAVDQELNDIILKAMGLLPQDRYPTMSAFAAALVIYVRQRTAVKATVAAGLSSGELPIATDRSTPGTPTVDFVRLECRQCGQGARAPLAMLGKRMLCPRCRTELTAPPTPLAEIDTTSGAKQATDRTPIPPGIDIPDEVMVPSRTKWWILGAALLTAVGAMAYLALR